MLKIEPFNSAMWPFRFLPKPRELYVHRGLKGQHLRDSVSVDDGWQRQRHLSNFIASFLRHCILLFELTSFPLALQEKLSLSFEPVIEWPTELALALAIEFVGPLLDLFLGWLLPVRRLAPCLVLSQFLLPPPAKVIGETLLFLADSFEGL